MHTRQPLPIPSSEALKHSERLSQLIIQEIEQAGGHIPFRHFMQMALYQPGFGYYVAGQEKFGTDGDFVTAPEISPLFSRCVANHCATIFAELTTIVSCDENSARHATILELGAGSGIMAAGILQHLSMLNCLPDKYLILEPGTELRQRQRETLQQHCPQLLERVQWLQQPPLQPIRGVILANEVIDAMPVELFRVTKNPESEQKTNIVISNLQVVYQQDEFRIQPGAAKTEQIENIIQTCLQTWDQHYDGYRPQQDYQSEYNPMLSGWIQSLSNTLMLGEILLIDYGYERNDYYRPERSRGTLLCHYRHHVHDQPLLWPGLQDITCSVDFTAVAEAAEDAGLQLNNYQTQADFLFSSGLESLFNTTLESHPKQQYQLAQQVRTLTLPAEMGERFKVMSLTKGFTSASQAHTLSASRTNDRRHRL